MNSLLVHPLAPATKPGDGAGLIFFKVLLVIALLSGGLAAGPADAGLTITTTGTIMSGSETGGLFGLPVTMTSLAGQSYTLIVEYDSLGPNYTTPGDGTSASDFEFPGIPGFVTAIINGVALTTQLTDSLFGTLLSEDMYNFFGANQGASSSGDNVNVSQLLACTPVGNPCIPFADLKGPVTYVPGPLDTSSDQYAFQGASFPAAGTPTANFTGTEATFASVPEPPSWVLLATGLLGLSIPVRRRQA